MQEKLINFGFLLSGSGRLGNEIIRLLSGLSIAEKSQATACFHSGWSGEDYISIPYQKISTRFAARQWSYAFQKNLPYSDVFPELNFESSIDLIGDGMPPTNFLSKSVIQDKLIWKTDKELEFKKMYAAINPLKKKVTVVHHRSTDFKSTKKFNTSMFRQTPIEWIVTFLENNLESDELLYIATDDPRKAKSLFSKFSDRIIKNEQANVYFDLFMLSRAEKALLSRSTFSFAGALMGRSNSKLYIPNFKAKKIEPLLDLWNSYYYFTPHPSLMFLKNKIKQFKKHTVEPFQSDKIKRSHSILKDTLGQIEMSLVFSRKLETIAFSNDFSLHAVRHYLQERFIELNKAKRFEEISYYSDILAAYNAYNSQMHSILSNAFGKLGYEIRSEQEKYLSR